MKSKNTKRGFGGLILMAFAFFMVASTSFAIDTYESFEIRAKNLQWWYEDIPLSNHVVTLPVGTELSYLNVDPLITSAGLEGVVPHGVRLTNQDGKMVLQSHLLFQDKRTFKFRLTEAGAYDLQCIVHPQMKGKFVVFNVQELLQTADLNTTE